MAHRFVLIDRRPRKEGRYSGADGHGYHAACSCGWIKEVGSTPLRLHDQHSARAWHRAHKAHAA